MANTVNLSSLPDYIEQHRDELLVKASVGAKSLDYVDLMLNVKAKDAINYLDSTVEFQAAACGWDPKGTDVFTQRYIEVNPIEIEKEFCYLDFRKKYMNYQLAFEAGRETLPFEQKIADSNVDAIKDALEELVWLGNSGVSVTGWIADAEAESATTVELGSGSTATAVIDAAVASATAAMLKKGVNIFVSNTLFRNYVAEQNGSCCANRSIIDAASESIAYVGDSRITIIPVAGLENASVAAVAASKDALVYGTDIESSESVYRMWFDEKEQKFMFRVLFNAGTALRWPDEVTLVTVA